MKNEDIIRDIIAEAICVSPDRVVPDATLFDLGADSLDVVELIMSLEARFNIDIPDLPDNPGETTVREVIDYVMPRIGPPVR